MSKFLLFPFYLCFFLCFVLKGMQAQNTTYSSPLEIIQQENYSTFNQLLLTADMLESFSENSFFLFAPTNEAFDLLPVKSLQRLMEPQNKNELKRILSNHIFTSDVEEAIKTLKNGEKGHFKSINGAEIVIIKTDKSTTIEDEKGRICKVIDELEGVSGISGLLNLFETRL